MKTFLFLCTLYLLSFTYAQDSSLEWVNGYAGIRGTYVTADKSGNTYMAGDFSLAYDFDPDTGVTRIRPVGGHDVFISKHDTDGKWMWTKTIGSTRSDVAWGITVDLEGNVYTVGGFQAKTDFDPGPDSFYVEPMRSMDIFLHKLDPDGNFLWVRTLHGLNIDYACAVTTDSHGNVIMTGDFRDSVFYYSGADTLKLTSNGDADVFVIKFDEVGNLKWGVGFGSEGSDLGMEIKSDAEGNIYTMGRYAGTADFDPGIDSLILSPLYFFEPFIQKLDSSGYFVWAIRQGGKELSQGNGIAIDRSGNLLLTGRFRDTVDFDPGPEIYNLVPQRSYTYEAFVQKLSPDAELIWVKQMQGTQASQGYGILTDNFDNVYVSGAFQDTVDFDPGPDNLWKVSHGSNDGFLQKLDSQGNLIWVKTIGGPESEGAGIISLDSVENIYLLGVHDKSFDFIHDMDTVFVKGGGISSTWFAKFSQNSALNIENKFSPSNIYPNPTNDFFYIDFPDISTKPLDLLRVFDVHGRKVKEFTRKNAPYYVGDLPKGVYVLLGQQGGKWLTSKLVVGN